MVPGTNPGVAMKMLYIPHFHFCVRVVMPAPNHIVAVVAPDGRHIHIGFARFCLFGLEGCFPWRL
jgi:hypothetical protein